MRHSWNLWLTGCVGVLICGPVLADDAVIEIPFQQFGHLIVVQVSVGEFHDLRFAIDTGTTTSVVTPGLTRKLGLKRERIDCVAFGRKVKAEKIFLPELRLGSLRIEAVPALVARLPRVPRSSIDGLIGIDLLKRTNLTIDFESGTVTLGSARAFGQSTTFLPRIPYLIIRTETPEGPLWLQLDSGSPLTLLFRGRVKGRVALTRTHRSWALRTPAGKLNLREVEIPELKIGGSVWQEYTAFLQSRHDDSLKYLDGVLGMSSLELQQVSFDFERNILSWQR